MAYDFQIPQTFQALSLKAHQPWELGRACGELLYRIAPLVSSHLEQPSNFKNKPPAACISTEEFTSAVDTYITYARTIDGCTNNKFPNDRTRRKYVKLYASRIEAEFKLIVLQSLGDLFLQWHDEQTKLFNKGVDKGLSGTQWRVYPKENVAVEMDEGDWVAWLRERCEELGILEVKLGRPALDN